MNGFVTESGINTTDNPCKNKSYIKCQTWSSI